MQQSKKKNDPGVGGQYEINVPAYFALQLNSSRDVEDFSIRSNVAGEFGNLDDIVINVTVQNGGPLNFAFQLKHREKGTNVSPGAFEGSKSKFSLEKYCAAFKNMSQDLRENYYFILYTCQNFDGNRKKEVKQFTMLEDERCPGKVLFDTSSDLGNTYKFEVNNETTRLDGTAKSSGVTRLDYQQFLSKLTLYTGQKKFQEFEKLILAILKEQNVVNSYLTLFRKWHQGLFTNKTIDRKTINYHLVDSYLSSSMITDYRLSDNEHETMYLFERATKDFDATIIDDPKENFSANLKTLEVVDDLRLKALEVSNIEKYRRQFKIDPKSTLTECILRMGKEHKFIEKAEMKLNETAKNKIFCFCLQKLLIVDFNQYSAQAVYNLMEVYRTKEDKIKFILLGRDVNLSRLSIEDVFYNLEDLAKKNDQLYQEIATQCRISLQGRPWVTLKQLLESLDDLESMFQAKELVQMLKDVCRVGGEKLELPQHYVPRSLSTTVFDLRTILDYAKDEKRILIVNFDGRIQQIEHNIRKEEIRIADIPEYIANRNSFEEICFILSTDGTSSTDEIDAICARELLKSVHVFKMIAPKTFILTRSSSKFTCQQSETRTFFQREVHCVFDGPLNLLVAEPGMGKSTFMRYLRNECPGSFWTIYVDVKSYSTFFRKARTSEEVLTSFLETESEESRFAKRLREAFTRKKRILLLLDGLDEVPTDCIDNVLDAVGSLSRMGLQLWVASRENLQSRLSDRFNLFNVRMVELDEEEQKMYMEDRLNVLYNTEEITEIIHRIFEGIKIIDNTQFLGIPLQLFILTQIFLDEKKHCGDIPENFFVLTKLYQHFFRGRFEHCFGKYPHDPYSPFVITSATYLKQYEAAALRSLLSDKSFNKLQICDEPNQDLLRKDALGIVARLQGRKARFEHQTYAEYFACVWFKNNRAKVKLLRDELFSENFEHLSLMLNMMMAEGAPLHLSVIYGNLEQFHEHLDDVDVTDEGGRTVLHIACTSGAKYNKTSSRPSDDPRWYIAMLEALFEIKPTAVSKKDFLFEFDCLDYACTSKCLYPIELALRKNLTTFSEWKRVLDTYDRTSNLVAHCLQLGYPRLLNEMLKGNHQLIDTARGRSLLEIAMNECCLNTRQELRERYADNVEVVIDNDVNFTERNVSTFDYNVHRACKFGLSNVVKKLWTKQIRAVNRNQHSLLHSACECANPNEDMIDFLVGKGFDVDAPNNKGTTPFHLACKNGQSGVVEKILQREDQVVSDILQTSDEEGNNALHYAVQSEKGNENVTTLLMDRSSTIRSRDGSLYVNARNRNGTTAFHLACKYRKFDVVKETLQREESVVSDILQTSDNNGNKALHYAAESKDDNQKVMTLLIQNSVGINSRNLSGQTALHWACMSYHPINVAHLLQMGADVNVADNYRHSALSYAFQSAGTHDKAEIVELFVRYNYDVSGKPATKALNIACQQGDQVTMKALMKRGAKIDDETSYYASRRGMDFLCS